MFYICCFNHVKIMIIENEKIAAILNEVIVNKLEIITYDIKYHINTNAAIAQSLDEEGINAFKFMDNEEINELIEIRNKTKHLARKLKNKLNSK
jgi:hypothetical protein